jgi:hypothetical protein
MKAISFPLSFILIFTTIIVGCSPRVNSKVYEKNEPKDPYDHVYVFHIDQDVPRGFYDIGRIRIGESGYSTKCKWEQVVQKAKEERRKLGGDAIKITEIDIPDRWSSCYRISVFVLKLNEKDTTATKNSTQS